MSGYLLDTGLVTAYLRGRTGAMGLLSPWIASHEAGTSIVVYGESIEYLRRFPDSHKWRASLRAMLRQIRVYDLTYAILETYADLRRSMRPPYVPGLIGDIDSLIAATALVYGLTVVTLDSDYTRVHTLSVMHLSRSAL